MTQMPTCSESSPTFVAFIWFFTRVNSHMFVQLIFGAERFIADHTAIVSRLVAIRCIVGSSMTIQFVLGFKNFPTNGTNERPIRISLCLGFFWPGQFFLNLFLLPDLQLGLVLGVVFPLLVLPHRGDGDLLLAVPTRFRSIV